MNDEQPIMTAVTRRRLYLILLAPILFGCGRAEQCEAGEAIDPAVQRHLPVFKAVQRSLIAHRKEVIEAFAKRHHGDTSEVYGSTEVFKTYLSDSVFHRSLSIVSSLDPLPVHLRFRPRDSMVSFTVHQYSCGDSITEHVVEHPSHVRKTHPKKIRVLKNLANGWQYVVTASREAGGY